MNSSLHLLLTVDAVVDYLLGGGVTLLPLVLVEGHQFPSLFVDV